MAGIEKPNAILEQRPRPEHVFIVRSSDFWSDGTDERPVHRGPFPTVAQANLKALSLLAQGSKHFVQILLEENRWCNAPSASRSRDKYLLDRYGAIWWVDEHGALSLKVAYELETAAGCKDLVVEKTEVIRMEVHGCCGELGGIGSIKEDGSFVPAPGARFMSTS